MGRALTPEPFKRRVRILSARGLPNAAEPTPSYRLPGAFRVRSRTRQQSGRRSILAQRRAGVGVAAGFRRPVHHRAGDAEKATGERACAGAGAGERGGIRSILPACRRPVAGLASGRETNYRCIDPMATLIGAIGGGLVGFFLRPSVPLLGQLPFETVISRGANLSGLDIILRSTAETSFNYLAAGLVAGAILGWMVGRRTAKA
jgi:hypothetical protein